MAERPSLKIVDLASLVRAVGAAREAGKIIVQCHGCFDIVHPGHVRYLKFARQQGDLLIVSLTGDAAIDKGPTRPYIPQELRAESLAALEFVDFVYVDPNPTACEVLERVRPDRYVKGREYQSSTSPEFLTEREVVERHGGRVVFSSGEVVFSSTQLISQMGDEPDLEWHRLRLFCRRHSLDDASAGRLLADMSGKRVIVVGDLLLDHYVLCDAVDVASESPMMALTKLDEQRYIGGAGIVARHVAALGGVPLLISAVGNDEASERVRQALVDDDIDSVLFETRQAMVEKTRYLVEENKLFKVEQGAAEPLDSVSLRRACQTIIDRGTGADAIILCDFGYGMISPALLEAVLPELRRGQPVISGDVSGHRANLLAMMHVDLLCPTERELRASVHDFDSGLAQVAYNVMHTTQARHLCVTLGKDGLVVFDRQSQDTDSPHWSGRLCSEHLPSLAHKATDRLGCGDAMLATMSLALAAGGNLAQAAYLGNGAAALELAKLGNVPVGHDALRRWLNARTEVSGKANLEFNLAPVP
jgi:rfaE bifunctional protein kinase chain/domain/rfaE bifunctional protein nucleotidyltransferase chain/domain